MPPKLLAKSDRASGVLPVNAATRAASAPANKQPATRLKLEVRRLPPGLTVAEFDETLGDDWKPGKGKISWREYRHGKIRSLGKLPEQSRCYMHLANEAAVKEFEQRFLAVVFHDKSGTHKTPDLKHLPPTLGYAPNQRVPSLGKQRVDNRQGTIDQDAEFIAFLEAETQPIVKPAALDALGTSKDESKVERKSTPLIDDLREKKANKAKAAASKAERKAANKAENKDVNAATPSKDTAKATNKAESKKTEQTAKDSAKVLSKGAAAKQSQPTTQAPNSQAKAAAPVKKKKEKEKEKAAPQTSNAPSSKPTATLPATTSPASQRAPAAQRARRDAEGIKKMLQKDLGIKPKDGGVSTGSTRTRAGGAQANTVTSAPAATTPPTQEKSSAGSVVAAKQSTAQASAQSANTALPTAPTTYKAFLKHANPSQGMTEALIQQALSQHGEVESVTIDTRKGTALAVFKTSEALRLAIQTRKVSVANGAVEVLEFKDRSAAAAAGSSRGGTRGAGRGGRGRGASASASVPASASASASVSATPATSTATTARETPG